MRSNSAWRRIINRKKRREAARLVLLHAGQLAEEMNLRLLLRQELDGEILFVEELVVTEFSFKPGKKTGLPERGRDWKGRIFSEEAVNGGRQQELDLARALAVVCLALVHCVIECTPEEQLAGGIPYLFDTVVGGPLSAPLFMFAMGIGMVYTRHNTPDAYIRRGIRIGLMGYLLNICRFLLPFLAGYGITGDYGKYIAPLPYRVLGNDILQFAGLAMLLIALSVRLRIPDGAMLLSCLGMSLLGTWLRGWDLGNPLGNIFMGYVIGTEDAAGLVVSDFPVMNWLMVPVSGYLFGKRLRHVKDKKRFYGFFSTAGALAAAICFALGIRQGRGMFGKGQNCYYHIATGDCLISLAAAVGILGICYGVTQYLPRRAMGWATEISRNTNAIYCIHWVLVALVVNLALHILRGTQALPVSRALLLGAGISLASILLAHFFTGRSRRRAYGAR